MARKFDEDELIEHWTLVGDELGQVAGKRGPTRLGFSLLLKFYTRHGRFPRGRGELPDETVDYLAHQVGVAATELAFYEWDGRTVEYHRAQVRKFLGFRECTVEDAEKLAVWLAEEVCQRERRIERVREELLKHCRDEGIEPPAAGRVGRIIGSGLRQAEKTLVARVAGRIPVGVAARMAALVAEASDDEDAETPGEDGRALFAQIRADPGNISLNTTREEIAKLTAIRAIGLPAGVFADVAPRVLAAWRDRVAVESPSHLRDDHPQEIKLTLLAALLHYRAGLIELIDALEFRSHNTVHRPVLDALELIKRYRVETTHATQYYARGEHVPVAGVIPADLAELLHRADKRGRQRVQRTVYECGVFQTLRERLRCKEIWVVGAEKWRNPDEDLPADFEAKRAENYAALRKPTNADAFVNEIREEMRAELAALHDALPRLGWLDIKAGRKQGAIVLTPYDAAPEPRNLRRLKQAVRARWGVVPLLDMLTEAALRTGCLAAFTPVGNRGEIDQAELAERLLLLVYAYGTNTGVRAVAAGDHGHSEDDPRYTRRRYMTVPACREVARAIANATFAARQAWLWGEGTTAVASDSTHFQAFDQNIFTEWHSRHRRGKRGVLIYWTVEQKGSMAVHSQLLSCSASEVHAMVEGAMRHGTDMTIESNYVDSHGASFIGFGITRLLGFDLIARFKQINQMKLYLPDKGTGEAYPLLEPALTRPIRWDLIGQQYDPMIKYATAIRLGTASTEAILRRFTRDVTHPAYAAMLELGRAQRTIFLARWLRDRGPSAGDHRRAQRGGELQRRQRLHPLRQVWRAGVQPPRGARAVHALPPHPSVLPRLREYLDAPRRFGRTGVGRHARRRRPARADPAVHLEHDALRRHPARHQPPPGPRRHARRAATGGTRGSRSGRVTATSARSRNQGWEARIAARWRSSRAISSGETSLPGPVSRAGRGRRISVSGCLVLLSVPMSLTAGGAAARCSACRSRSGTPCGRPRTRPRRSASLPRRAAPGGSRARR